MAAQALAFPREIEIKFSTDAAGLKLAMEWQPFAGGNGARTQNLNSIYYDTSNEDLRRHNIAMRVRKEGRSRHVLTVKSSSGNGNASDFVRRETEAMLPHAAPDPSFLDAETAGMISQVTGKEPLQIRFATQVRRRSVLVPVGQSEIEVAIDDGHIVAGDRKQRLFEVELELRNGQITDLYSLAMQAVQELPLTLDFSSKGDKGFKFCNGELPLLEKTRPSLIRSDWSSGQVASAILSGALYHFTRNWAVLRETEQPEAIHQLRVALRRMRSALRMLGRKMPQAEFQTLRAEARRIATGFGPAREIDVFLEAAQSGPLASAECPPGGDLLLQVMNKRRHAAYAEARNVINSRDASLFVLRMHAFIAELVAAEPQPSMEQPAMLSACKQARKILRWLESRVQKRGSGLQDLSEEARHRLRIALKDLRYGAEFFSSLFKRKKRAARFLQSISELQEVLGSQNDVVATKALITSSSGELGKSSQALLGFLLGWYAHQARVSEEAVMKTWKNFQKLDGFWH